MQEGAHSLEKNEERPRPGYGGRGKRIGGPSPYLGGACTLLVKRWVTWRKLS